MLSSYYLSQQKKGKNTEKQQLEYRKFLIDRIKVTNSERFESSAERINFRITLMRANLSAGLKGSKKSTSVVSKLENEIEKYPSSDTKLIDVSSNLKKESKRCQQRINELSSEISSLNRKINIAKEEEKNNK